MSRGQHKVDVNHLKDGDFEQPLGSSVYPKNDREPLRLPDMPDPRVSVPRMDFGPVTQLVQTHKPRGYTPVEEADISKAVTKIDKNARTRESIEEDIQADPLYAEYSKLSSKKDFGPTWAERHQAYKEQTGQMDNLSVTNMDEKNKTNIYDSIDDDLSL